MAALTEAPVPQQHLDGRRRRDAAKLILAPTTMLLIEVPVEPPIPPAIVPVVEAIGARHIGYALRRSSRAVRRPSRRASRPGSKKVRHPAKTGRRRVTHVDAVKIPTKCGAKLLQIFRSPHRACGRFFRGVIFSWDFFSVARP
jgi:hypothetical protein